MALLQQAASRRVASRQDAVSSSEDYLALKKLNSQMAALQLLTQDDSIETMPQWVGFAATTYCNLECPHCQTHGTPEKRAEYNQKRWPEELLNGLIAECLPTAQWFSLTLSGEPLAVPGLKEHLKNLARYRAKLQLNTNGILLNKNMLVRLLPVTGFVCVSVDGATKFTSEQLRRGSKFERLLTNVRLLSRVCELLPPEMRPELNISFVLMGSNLREMPQMVRMAHGLHVPKVSFNPLIVFYPHLANEDLSRHKALYNACYEQAQQEAIRLGVQIVCVQRPFVGVEPDPHTPRDTENTIVRQWPEDYRPVVTSYDSFLDRERIETEAPEIADRVREQWAELGAVTRDSTLGELDRVRDELENLIRRHEEELGRLGDATQETVRYCDYLCRHAFMDVGGDVTPCCQPKRPVMGNIHRNGIREIWNSEAYRDFRRRFHSADMPECCRNCNHVVSKPKEEFLRKLEVDLPRS